MAFGSILEGPDSTKLQPIVKEAMPMLIRLMKDDSVAVKDTAAWTIGRVCEMNSEAAINENYLQVFIMQNWTIKKWQSACNEIYA